MFLWSADGPYEWRHRKGVIDGQNHLVTYDGTSGTLNSQNERPGAKLYFTDRVLVSGGWEMARARDYTYFQYGNGWAKILGLASGTAPSLSCPVRFALLDVRDVFPHKSER